MNRFLLLSGARGIAIFVVLAAIGCYFLLGTASGLGALVGGILAGADFLLLVYAVGQLLDGNTSSTSRAALSFAILFKFVLLAALFWVVFSWVPVEGAGVALGIGAAICGFTLGLRHAASSSQGEALIREEEARIGKESRDEVVRPE